MSPARESGWESIPAMVSATVAEHGDRIAIVEGESRLSYAELAEEARRFGASSVALGVGPGDRVAIWAPNCTEWIVAALGTWAAGAVVVPVNSRFKGGEAADVLRRSGARMLVTVTDLLGSDLVALLAGSGVELPDLQTIVVVQGPVSEGALGWAELLGRATTEHATELDRRALAVGADDVSDILFTSGTTGTPKGVVQTHGRTLAVAGDWPAMTGLRAGDRYLMVNPYFHMFGLKAGILASISVGATMYPEAVFDAERAMARVAADAITVLPGAPTLYQALLDHPARSSHDLSSLRIAVTGAADIPVELVRRIFAELPFSVVVTGYGLTEAGTATATRPGDDPETIATTVGRPRPGFEVRIVDHDGVVVSDGQPGEIVLRGPSTMAGYLDDAAATAAAWTDDGWLRTGDLGIVGDDGNLRIVGRSKDMYIVGGFNAYPAEIENLLLGHPDIREVAVVGVPDERLGEVGVAFVVLSPDADAAENDIVDWSRSHMANYKVPRAVELVDELPRNATGKVAKEELRQRVLAERPGGPT